MHYMEQSTPDNKREQFILSTGTSYLVYPTSTVPEPFMTRNGPAFLVDLSANTPPYLTKVYVTKALLPPVQDAFAGSYTIFKINR
jgi:NAD-dependent SIR2 family protein deacetylase